MNEDNRRKLWVLIQEAGHYLLAGFLSKDKAILTNFGLQIPLFLIGFYQLLF